MNQEKTLLLTRQTIINHFGNIDDLPHEFANTIANVYYRYLSLTPDPDDASASIEDFIPKNEFEKMQKEMKSEFEFANKAVNELRRLRQQAHSSLVEISCDVFLSILKYRIPDAANKSPVRLKFERFLNRHKVTEIPGLIDSLQITESLYALQHIQSFFKGMNKKWLKTKIGVKQAGNLFNNRPVTTLGTDRTTALIARMQEGDELWSFSSDQKSWENRAGRSGSAVIRNGEIIDGNIQMMS